MSACSTAISCIERMRWSVAAQAGRPADRRAGVEQRHQRRGAARRDRFLDFRQRADMDHRPIIAASLRRARQGLIEPLPCSASSAGRPNAQAVRHGRSKWRKQDAAVRRARENRSRGIRMLDEAEQRRAAADGNADGAPNSASSGAASCASRARMPSCQPRSASALHAHIRAPARRPPKARVASSSRCAVAVGRNGEAEPHAGEPEELAEGPQHDDALLGRHRRRGFALARPDIHEGLVDDQQAALARSVAASSSSSAALDDPPVRIVRIDDDRRGRRRPDRVERDRPRSLRGRRATRGARDARHRSAPAPRRGRAAPAMRPAAAGFACRAPRRHWLRRRRP